MNPDRAGVGRPGLSGRLRGAVKGLLVGMAAGGACAFGLEAAYRYVLFGGYSGPLDDDEASLLLRVFLSIGLGAGALLGAALDLRNASRRRRSVPVSPAGGVVPRNVLARLGWTVLGAVFGGVLFGAAALSLSLEYFNVFPRIPDEGGSGYAILLLILPAGIVTGSICGGAAGWRGAVRASGWAGRMRRAWRDRSIGR